MATTTTTPSSWPKRTVIRAPGLTELGGNQKWGKRMSLPVTRKETGAGSEQRHTRVKKYTRWHPDTLDGTPLC